MTATSKNGLKKKKYLQEKKSHFFNKIKRKDVSLQKF
jgi:hypothetical protein